MDTTERIKLIMKYYSIDEETFAKKVGIMSTTLDHILKGRKNASLDIIKKIISAFPEINSEWLLMGKGAMQTYMESTTERIKLIMKYYSIDKVKFAEKVGMMPTTLDHILKGRKNATLDNIKMITSAFPEISSDWLILGNGAMNNNTPVSKVIEELFSTESNVRRIKEMLTYIYENPEI